MICVSCFFSDSLCVHVPFPFSRATQEHAKGQGARRSRSVGDGISMLSSTLKTMDDKLGKNSDLQILHCTLLRICENTDDWSPHEEKQIPWRPSAGKEYDSLWKGMKELANIPADDTASKRLEIRHTVDGCESLRQLVEGLSHHNPILVSVFHWNPNSYLCRMAGLFIPSTLQPNRGVWEITERYNSAGPSNCHLLKRWVWQ